MRKIPGLFVLALRFWLSLRYDGCIALRKESACYVEEECGGDVTRCSEAGWDSLRLV